jgi:hypothetical protein
VVVLQLDQPSTFETLPLSCRHLLGVGAAAVAVVVFNSAVHAQGDEQPVGGEGGDDPARDGGARRGDRPIVEVVRRQLWGLCQRMSVDV